MPTEVKKAADLTALKKISEGAAKTGLKLKSMIDGLRDIQAKERKKIVDNNLELMDLQQRKTYAPQFEKMYKDWNRKFLKENDEARWAELRTLQGAYEALSYARETLTNPLKLSAMHNLGGEARSRIELSLQNAGPSTLKSLAEKAELTGDMDLAAALISVNDSRARPDRGFSSPELAAKVWAVPVAEAKQLCDAVDIEHKRAIKLNREMEGKGTTALQLLEEGIKFGPDGLTTLEKPVPREMTDMEKMINGLPFSIA